MTLKIQSLPLLDEKTIQTGSKSILVGKELQQLKNLIGEESRFDYTEEEFSSMNRDRRILLRFQEK